MKKLNDTVTFRRGLNLKNRIIMAPMTTKMSFYDGGITTDEINYYGLRSGEVGAVITAAANVQKDGKGWEGELGVYDDSHIQGLSNLASTIKKRQTKAILQIFHAGRMTDSTILRGTQPIAPSSIPSERPGAQVPREMTEKDILQLIKSFKKATERAIKAGFDGVEIHGANTFIIQQFFSPHSNRRNDKWGGSLEKRYHFIERLVEEIIDTVDNSTVENFIIGYRFSPEEFEKPGISFADTLFLIDKLSDKKLDYLHISLNHYNRKSIAAEYQEKAILEYVYQKINNRVPLIGIGDVRSANDANNVLTNADFVAIGRSIIIDPHWTQKVMAQKESLIRTSLSVYDREELFIQNGIIEFLNIMMPERLK